MKKTLKILLSLLLTAAMMLSLAACGSGKTDTKDHDRESDAEEHITERENEEKSSSQEDESSENDSGHLFEKPSDAVDSREEPHGKYIIRKVREDGAEEDLEEAVEALGQNPKDQYYLFNKDGTGKVSFMGSEAEFAWGNGILTSNEESMKYEVKGNQLIIKNNGSELICEKAGGQPGETDKDHKLPFGDEDPSGKYLIRSVRDGGEEESIDEVLASMDQNPEDQYYLFNEDGTGKASFMGMVGEFTWGDGILSANGESVNYKVRGDQVIIESNGSEMICEKAGGSQPEETEEEHHSLFAPSEEPSGKYLLTKMTEGTNTLDREDLDELLTDDEDMYILFNEDGTGELVIGGVPTEFTWQGNVIEADGEEQEFECQEDTVTMSDGEMTLTFEK